MPDDLIELRSELKRSQAREQAAIRERDGQLAAIRAAFPEGHPARTTGNIAEGVRYLQNYFDWVEKERDTLQELLRKLGGRRNGGPLCWCGTHDDAHHMDYCNEARIALEPQAVKDAPPAYSAELDPSGK